MDARQGELNRAPTSESERISRDIDCTRERIGDTVGAIQDRLTFRNLSQGFVELLADGAGVGSRKLMQGIKDNPIPAAIVGLGVAWLLVDRAAARRADRYDGGLLPRRRTSAVKEAIGDAADRVGEKASDLTQKAGEQVASVAAGVRHTAADIGHKVRGSAEVAKEKVSHVAGQAKDAADRARRGLWDTYDTNPLAVGAAAFALGLVGGLAAPTSRAEDKLMGRASRDLKDRAKDVGRRAMEAGKDIASKSAEAAKQSASEGSDTTERLVHATEAAINTAASETARHARTIAETASEASPGRQA